MSDALALAELAGQSRLRDAFLRWQCRARQNAARLRSGRPDAAMVPELTPVGASEPAGSIITVLNKHEDASHTPELIQMAKRTADPAERRRKALEFFSETYFQQPKSFADTLTAVFAPDSRGAARIASAGACTLDFDAYGQRWSLSCAVEPLSATHPLYLATWWHNYLFNPALPPASVVLAFEPDWASSSASPRP